MLPHNSLLSRNWLDENQPLNSELMGGQKAKTYDTRQELVVVVDSVKRRLGSQYKKRGSLSEMEGLSSLYFREEVFLLAILSIS